MKVIKSLKKYKENYKHSPLLQNKIESEYISLIYLKDLKKFKIENTSEDKIDYTKLKTKYKKYMVLTRLFDKEIINKKKEIVEGGKIITNVNYNKYKENYMNNKYNHKGSRMVNIFKNLEVMLNKKSRISKVVNYKIQNIVEDHSNYINNKKISNNLLRPYYFFPAGYIEGPKPTQIRQWTSSIYNFLKLNKVNYNYLDSFTGKLIKLYFNVKYIRKRLIWDLKFPLGFKIIPDLNFYRDINTIIHYTSRRTKNIGRDYSWFSPAFLKIKDIKDQLLLAIDFGRIFKYRKLTFQIGFYPKRKTYFRKLGRILLGKPFFKHTSLNLIIDLFLYNNKRYKLKKIKNLTLRRGIYKYMYSMYIDYSQKIKDTLNRPRFFYMNLIEPKLYKIYNNIIQSYNTYIWGNKKSVFIYFCLLALNFNLFIKIKYNSIISNSKIITNKIENIYDKFNYDINNININVNFDNEIRANTNIFVNKNIDNYLNNKKILNSISKQKLIKSSKSKMLKIKILSYNIINKKIWYSGKKFIYNNKNNINLVTMKNLLEYNFPYIINTYDYINIYNKNKLLAYYVKAKNENLDKTNNNGDEEKITKFEIIRKYLADLRNKSNKPLDQITFKLWKTKNLYLIKKGLKIKGKIKSKGKSNIENNRLFINSSYKKNKELKDPRILFLKDRLAYNKKKGNKNRNVIIKNKIIIRYNLNDPNNLLRFQIGIPLLPENYKPENFNWLKHVLLPNEEYKKKKNKSYFSKSNKKIENININKINNNYLSTNNIIFDTKLFIDSSNTNIFKNTVYLKLLKLSNDFTYNTNIFNRDNSYIYNNIISTFYIKNKTTEDELYNYYYNNNYDIYNLIKSKFVNEIISFNKRKNNILNKINVFYKKDKSDNIKNNRILWNKFDNSIMNILSNYTNTYKNKEIKLTKLGSRSLFQFNKLFENLKRIRGFGNIWYMYYFLAIVEKEYEKIYNDVIISKDYNIISYSYDIQNKGYYEKKDLKNITKFGIYESTEYEFILKIWPAFFSNYNDEKINLGYNESIFKAKYRNLIQFTIINYYYNLLVKIGKENLKDLFNYYKYFDIKGLNNINYKLYKFITVKVLLELLRYNYRSLIRIKSRYYFINKFRLYLYKFRRVNFNNWIASMRFIKKLRKTPKNFWYRLNFLAYTFFKKITRYTYLDTKVSLVTPFIMHFEDILYTIYGKWTLIRVWPLKRHYLSSYLLARRVLTLILWRKKKISNKYNFQRMISRLMSGIRILQIRKAYHYYNEFSSRWPDKLISKLNNNIFGYLNYTNLEWYNEDHLKKHQLESYNIPNNTLASFIPNYKFNYMNAFDNNIDRVKNYRIKKNILSNKITNLQYMYYWLRPLKKYIMTLKNNLDITGLRLRLSGRIGIRRNNLRSIYKNRIYGNLLGPIHKNIRSKKIITIVSPKLRGYMKSNVDFAIYVSKSKNGTVSLKVWISSIFSTDLRELLLHLVYIKDLYSQLINRFYIIKPYFNYIKNNYLLKLPSSNIIIPTSNKNKLYREFKNLKKSKFNNYNKSSITKNKKIFINKNSYYKTNNLFYNVKNFKY